ncbi:MAG: hypothetical protein OSJ71_07495 [Acetatifactor sp.]|nr:hypothetical protein [Acetatifactor sp.]
MFEHASVMVLMQDEEGLKVRKIETDRETQEQMCQNCANAYKLMKDGMTPILFNENHISNVNKVLYIPNLTLADVLREALEIPAGVERFISSRVNADKIKAIFIGEVYYGKIVIAFQKFKREHHINAKRNNLFFDRETFVQDKRFNIPALDEIDCLYEDGKLLFISEILARQIINLKALVSSDGKKSLKI